MELARRFIIILFVLSYPRNLVSNVSSMRMISQANDFIFNCCQHSSLIPLDTLFADHVHTTGFVWFHTTLQKPCHQYHGASASDQLHHPTGSRINHLFQGYVSIAGP